MANNIIKRVWNQGSMTPIEDLQGSAFTNENGGHTFQISGVDSNGEALALSGTVAASFLRPDQTTVGISGSVSGGVASVTLSEECYGIPGRFGLVVFLTSDGKKAAIYSCVGNVARSSTDAVAPGVVADVVDLINEIQAAVDTIPASYSALMADIAPTYSSSALYAVGDYAWYEGDLKRCIVPITVGETYTPAHWTSAVVGDDVCALKSAINHIGNPPNLRESTEENVDLDIADENGNVLARFSNGDIHTKNFSSSKILGCKLTNDENVDFEIVDILGNVLARFADGHIKTKNFDSSDIIANGYLKGKVIVNFGDSIFGNKRPPNDISTTIANETGATVYNCGFGGCRMANHDSSRLSTWGQFSMWELADAIAEDDWTGQESAIENFPSGEMPSYFPETLALLETIDFSKVDIVTIAYGTNDFTAGTNLDDSNNPTSTSTFAGALRYSIETLLTAFPNLRIICCGQCYRWWDNSGAFVDDSNTHEVNGQLLTQFVSKTKDVAEEYNLQFINNYDIGIGKFTRSYFFTGADTTHPNDIGTKLIARHIARELY